MFDLFEEIINNQQQEQEKEQEQIIRFNKKELQNKFFDDIFNIILSAHGIIFGGAVRDYIYKHKTKQQIITTDIDVFFHEKDVHNFLFTINSLNYHVEKIKVNKNEIYVGNNFFVENYKITKQIINLDNYKFNCEVLIDIVTSKQDIYYPTFSRLDFSVNSLCLSQQFLMLSTNTGTYYDCLEYIEKQEKLCEIIQMIKVKETLVNTTWVKTIKDAQIIIARMTKMILKGYNILNGPFKKIDFCNITEDNCVICREDFTKDDSIYILGKKTKIYFCKYCLHNYSWKNVEKNNEEFGIITPLREFISIMNLSV